MNSYYPCRKIYRKNNYVTHFHKCSGKNTTLTCKNKEAFHLNYTVLLQLHLHHLCLALGERKAQHLSTWTLCITCSCSGFHALWSIRKIKKIMLSSSCYYVPWIYIFLATYLQLEIYNFKKSLEA